MVLLFLTIYITHVLCPVISSGDSRWSIFCAYSLITEGNLNLDEYADELEEHAHYAVDTFNGHQYNLFPFGTSILAAPFVLVLDSVSRLVLTAFPALETRMLKHCSKPIDEITVLTLYWRVELLIACFFVAAASLFIYLIARRFLEKHYALVLVFIFAYCTSTWSSSSRALWQHGPSAFMLSMALYLILLADKKPAIIQFSSLPLAYAYIIRPTNSIPIMLLSAYVLYKHRPYFVRYLLWSLPVAVPFMAYNLYVYGWILAPYYAPKRLGASDTFGEALIGLLISPARGLFIYTPIFLLVFAGMAIRVRKKCFGALDSALASLFVLHWLALASFQPWWAGHSFGPRFFADLTPFYVYFLIPVFQLLPQLPRARKRLLGCALTLCVAISFLIHFRGATSLDCHAWNQVPVLVDEAPSRLWDWKDPPFLRGLGSGVKE